MLTGKAKSDFEQWYWNVWLTDSDRDCNEKYEVIENSWKAEKMFLFPLIIEWLDSVGIYVDVQPYVEIDETKKPAKIFFFQNVIDLTNMENSSAGDDNYSTRKEATKAAIEKANELYNKSKNEQIATYEQ